jgi:predicted methyltransferase
MLTGAGNRLLHRKIDSAAVFTDAVLRSLSRFTVDRTNDPLPKILARSIYIARTRNRNQDGANMKRQLQVFLAGICLTACSGGEPPPDSSMAAGADSGTAQATDSVEALSEYQAAVANETRSESDRARDKFRKPAEVLEFFHVESGMTVLDMFSGGGYYAEILSHLVGSDGKVYAQNNQAYVNYASDELTARYIDGRLLNVERVNVEVEDVALPANSVDVALLVLSYHDLYYKPVDGSWPDVDGPRMLSDMYRFLKPGGVLGVVDHDANSGLDKIETATRLHRIQMMIARCEIEAAGFAFDGSSDVLRNPEDDRDKPMFAEGIRGKTDRFVLRFHKPIDGSEEGTLSGECVLTESG